MSIESMRFPCEVGPEGMRRGRIHGMIVLASRIGDLPLDRARWTRRWIAEHGAREVPASPRARD